MQIVILSCVGMAPGYDSQLCSTPHEHARNKVHSTSTGTSSTLTPCLPACLPVCFVCFAGFLVCVCVCVFLSIIVCIVLPFFFFSIVVLYCCGFCFLILIVRVCMCVFLVLIVALSFVSLLQVYSRDCFVCLVECLPVMLSLFNLVVVVVIDLCRLDAKFVY